MKQLLLIPGGSLHKLIKTSQTSAWRLLVLAVFDEQTFLALREHHLLIRTSTLLLSGNYTCEVEWDGSPISITHKLTVLVPPSIEAVLPGGLGQVDHPIEAREGSQVRLECRAEGIPPPIVRWRSPVSSKELQSISIWYVVAAVLGTIILWYRGKRAFLLCKKEATFNNCGLFELLLETFTLCGAFLHCYSRFGSRSIITLKKEPPCYYYNLVAL